MNKPEEVLSLCELCARGTRGKQVAEKCNYFQRCESWDPLHRHLMSGSKSTSISMSHSQGAYCNIFSSQNHLYILYNLSQCKFSCVDHPTVDAGELSPGWIILNRKEVKQQMESLNSQLEEVTRETKELRDWLISITKRPPENKFICFQRHSDSIIISFVYTI